MTPLEKSFAKLSASERILFLKIFEQVRSGDIRSLDVKKLQGKGSLFRVRVGAWRIVFERKPDGNHILRFGHRNEKTYRDL